MKLTRSQKKGAGNHSYARHFLKKKVQLTAYNLSNLTQQERDSLYVHELKKQNLGNAILMNIRSKVNQKISYYWVAPEKISENTFVNSGQELSPIVKALKDYQVGDTVCGIEFKNNASKFYCTSAGSSATIAQHDFTKNKTKLKIKGKRDYRFITLPMHMLALNGRVSNSGQTFKPFIKAGNAYYLKKSKGQKYPHMSCMSMNVHQHPLGGKYKRRKGISLCTSHRDSPGAKFGCISPKRTGKSK